MPLSQSRTDSFTEALANVAVGFATALLLQTIVFPLFGIETTSAEDAMIALLFTLASLLRSYLLRRLFIRLEQHRQQRELARQASLARRLATGRLK